MVAIAQAKLEVTDPVKLLRDYGFRPTKQRLAMVDRLLNAGNRHVTAEQLHGEFVAAGVRISLATVYNALHEFTKAGLVKKVVVDPERIYFDTNLDDHHHFYNEVTGALHDFSAERVVVSGLPRPPEKYKIDNINVIVRVGPNGPA